MRLRFLILVFLEFCNIGCKGQSTADLLSGNFIEDAVLTAVYPTNNEVAVPLNPRIIVVSTRAWDLAKIKKSAILQSAIGTEVPFEATAISELMVALVPLSALNPGTKYVLTMPSSMGVKGSPTNLPLVVNFDTSTSAV